MSETKEQERVRIRLQIHGLKLETLSWVSQGTPVCRRCGMTDIRVLTIDHVFGNGSDHRKLVKGNDSSALYRWLRRHGYPNELRDEFQVLCSNCHLIKEAEESGVPDYSKAQVKLEGS